jgi:hypothetical protein
MIHKNLFCGTGMSIIATEEFLDRDRSGMSADDLVSEMIVSSDKLLRCKSCNRVVILREKNGEIDAQFFTPND